MRTMARGRLMVPMQARGHQGFRPFPSVFRTACPDPTQDQGLPTWLSVSGSVCAAAQGLPPHGSSLLTSLPVVSALCAPGSRTPPSISGSGSLSPVASVSVCLTFLLHSSVSNPSPMGFLWDSPLVVSIRTRIHPDAFLLLGGFPLPQGEDALCSVHSVRSSGSLQVPLPTFLLPNLQGDPVRTRGAMGGPPDPGHLSQDSWCDGWSS